MKEGRVIARCQVTKVHARVEKSVELIHPKLTGKTETPQPECQQDDATGPYSKGSFTQGQVALPELPVDSRSTRGSFVSLAERPSWDNKARSPRQRNVRVRCKESPVTIPPIFVISLADSTARRDSISKHLRHLGLDFTFVEAVDGRSGLSPAMEELVDRDEARARLGRDMTDAEIACALSHTLVYKRMLNEKLESAVILEDDMVPTEDFLALLLSGRLQQSRQQLILLYYNLAQALKWSFRPCISGYSLFKFAALPSSAAAYYLDRSAAKRLLEAAYPVVFVADWPLFVPLKLRTSGVYPSVMNHSLSPSTLAPEREEMLQEVSAPPSSRDTIVGTFFRRLRHRGVVAALDYLYQELFLPRFAVTVGGTDEENAAGKYYPPELVR